MARTAEQRIVDPRNPEPVREIACHGGRFVEIAGLLGQLTQQCDEGVKVAALAAPEELKRLPQDRLLVFRL